MSEYFMHFRKCYLNKMRISKWFIDINWIDGMEYALTERTLTDSKSHISMCVCGVSIQFSRIQNESVPNT